MFDMLLCLPDRAMAGKLQQLRVESLDETGASRGSLQQTAAIFALASFLSYLTFAAGGSPQPPRECTHPRPISLHANLF